MSQFMDVMMGQQSLIMSLANMAPRATDATVGPIANQPAFPPKPLSAPVVQQPQGVWNVDAISRDASEGEPLLEEDSVEAELTSQHSEQDTELEMLDTNDPLWSLVERATRHLGIGEVTVPTIIVLNTSNQQYFLPSQPIEHIEDLVRFINEVLDGTAQTHHAAASELQLRRTTQLWATQLNILLFFCQAQGGDGILQRIKRVIYDVKSTVVSVFKSSPLLGCFLFGLPLGVISIICYGICTADSDDDSEEAELLKREGRDQELTDEGSEEELEDGNDEQQPESGAEYSDEEREEKTSTEKKTD
ncbi:UNVERIFIED_CONTAM: hypothetical protein FKN15_055087 [Acipenser sinensis]